MKGRRIPGGKDLTIAPALIPVLAGDVPVLDLSPLVEDQVPEGECLLVGGAPPDVAPLAPDTDIDAPPSAGGALALLHRLAAALQALARLKKQ